MNNKDHLVGRLTAQAPSVDKARQYQNSYLDLAV